MNQPRGRDGQQNGATLLALIGLMLIAGGLLALMTMVMPGLSGILLVIWAFVFFGVFHYVVWGRWMTARRDGEEDDSEEE